MPTKFKTAKAPCKHCGSLKRYVSNSWCVCTAERYAAHFTKYTETHREEAKARVKAWHKKHGKEQRQRLKVSIQAKNNKHRADKTNATPKWYDKEQEKSMIHFKNLMTNTFKEEHHLDHIIPLNHPKVCGLHCKDNWQILTAKDNLAKSNKWDGTYNNTGE